MVEKSAERGPKFRRRAAARPDEVLDAALKLFEEKGFAATRVEDIAARAGISKGAVYLYFRSKEHILEGLVRRAVTPVADSALASLSAQQGDPRAILATVIRMLGMRFSDPQVTAIPKILLREMAGFPQLAQMYRAEIIDRVLPVAEALIARGIAEGHLRPVDPELAVRSIIGPIIAHLLLSELFGIRPADGLAMDRLVENHLKILFDGLAAPGEGGQ
ncbi:MAG TPA: TetR/AcrR family transcriptional regulator [Devosia sp.]|nr:TetR/AcrR family transcriptional regulator [Devosia sp.]